MALPQGQLQVWILPGSTPEAANLTTFPDDWTEVTGRIRYSSGVTVKAGRKDEYDHVEPAGITVTFDNRDGHLSPHNPESPFYPNLTRNTPLIVTWGLRPIQVGAVVEWKPVRHQSRNDATTTIRASGVLRRLAQGRRNTPIKSAIHREILSPARPLPVAYWPGEDGRDATELGSVVDGAAPMIITGDAQLAAFDDWPASEPLPTMNGARFVGPLPNYPVTGENLLRVFYNFPAGGSVNGTQIMGFPSSGTAARWAVFYETGGVLRIAASDQDGNEIENAAFSFGVDGHQTSISLEVTASGGDLAWTLLVVKIFADGTTSGAIGSDTIVGHTIGRVQNVVINFNRLGTDISFGHVVFASETTIFAGTDAALVAHAGELAGDRMLRLGDEEGITVEVVGNPSTETVMGPQRPASVLTLLRECEDADGGVLYEALTEFGLEYRNRAQLYNQVPTMTLAREAGEIAGPPEPVDDDQSIANDVTVSRVGGSSFRITDPASIEAHDLYQTSAELNVLDDSQLPNLASWRLHLGTVDEPRWPVLELNLARNPHLIDAWLDVRFRVANRLVATYATPQEPDIPIDVLVQGWTDKLTLDNWTVELNCSPASPWDVAHLDDLSGTSTDPVRLDTAGSTLNQSFGISLTSFPVASGSNKPWVTDPAQFPFDVIVNGEVMTVTAISGATSPQTFTVIRSVNGVVRSHLFGSDVRLAKPMILAL